MNKKGTILIVISLIIIMLIFWGLGLFDDKGDSRPSPQKVEVSSPCVDDSSDRDDDTIVEKEAAVIPKEDEPVTIIEKSEEEVILKEDEPVIIFEEEAAVQAITLTEDDESLMILKEAVQAITIAAEEDDDEVLAILHAAVQAITIKKEENPVIIVSEEKSATILKEAAPSPAIILKKQLEAQKRSVSDSLVLDFYTKWGFLSKLSIKTNLLSWAAMAPNIGFEYQFSPYWSLSGSFTMPWWSNDSKHQRYRLQLYEVENRRYFGADNRHHLGVYLQGGTFDFKFREIGAQGNFGAAGISYGYLLPLNRRLHIDFEIGFGYLVSEYERYEIITGDYVYMNTRKTNLFAPTKLGVSLVWKLGDKYRLRARAKKEGEGR